MSRLTLTLLTICACLALLVKCEGDRALVAEKAMADHLAADEKLTKDRRAENAERERMYMARAAEADEMLADARRALADLRAQPVKRLRCEASRVPATAGEGDSQSSAGSPAGAGALPQKSDPGFDPTPGVLAGADEADDLVETVRAALEKCERP